MEQLQALEDAQQAPEPALLEAFNAQAAAAPVADSEPFGYVVSITRGGRHRKLHHVGSCRLVPGVDYKEFDVYGNVMPPLHLLNSKCHRCFGTTSLQPEVEEESAAESLDSSSSSRSGVPAGKKPRTG